MDDALLNRSKIQPCPEQRAVGTRLQEIEGNPLDADDIAMFEMFEREAWSHEQRHAYIVAQIKVRASR